MSEKTLDSKQPKMTSTNSQLASMYGNDFLELVWQNGQILVQTATASSSRTRKGSSLCTAEYSTDPSSREEAYADHEDAACITKGPRLSSLYPILDFQDYSDPNSKPTLQDLREEIYNAHDSYHFDFRRSKTKTSKEHHPADARLMQLEGESAANLRPGKDQSKITEKAYQLAAFGNSEVTYSSNSLRQCPNSAQFMTPRIGSVSRIPETTGEMLASKLSQKKDYLGSDHQRNGKENFSNFLRPSFLLKPASQGNSATRSLLAGLTGLEEIKTRNDIEKPGEASSSKAPESVAIDPAKVSHSLAGIIQDQTALGATKANSIKTFGANNNTRESPIPDEHSEAVDEHRLVNQTSNLAANKAKGKPDNSEFCNEPLVASSSVCSLGASNDPTYLSRKHEDTDDSTYFSDNDEEPEGVREVHTREGTRAKRSRNPVVHNLSERKRRDKINKKMHALKELIPNCKKVDKASMLDDAIEYLKALQLQLQIMSMGAGLCMPMMMLPAGAPHMNPIHLPQFPPMGPAGMALRPCTIPHQFPPTQLGPTPSLTDNGLQMLAAFPNQAVLPPISIPHAPFLPMLGQPSSSAQPSVLATSPGTAIINPIEHLSSASLTSLKESVPNNSDLNAQPECPTLMPPSNNQASG